MKISSFFKNHHHQEPTRLQWPSCKNPKTLSFRGAGDDDIIKTVNSVFFDPLAHANEGVETPETWFTNSSTSARSLSSESALIEEFDGESLEMVVRGARSDRLFFEPGDTSSILEEAKTEGFPFQESVVLAMESEDPYVDFRRSMEEMVETHGLKDWEYLEELLGWYLRVNGKKNHGFIVDAFVDLLVALASNSSSSSAAVDSTSYSSAVSSFSSSSLSPLSHEIGINEINEVEKMVAMS
ncbi:transcription repressor OFP13-like [Mangifera indica]|uniref:transcription repressor OFP13-like n=1 Tax=Mangifera indica TaxID=29780 RepID=UPI001CF9ED2B|nr:transcription repressor OFP13-like [Mangifera indica]